jgi:DNA-binding transcriptional LysR family regulator
VGLSRQHRDHLAVGAHATLWDGFLLKWIAWLRGNCPDIAISASASLSATMIQRLLEGTLDLAIMYRPGQPPGLTIEHLFDEEFVLVTSVPGRLRLANDYVFVDWGQDFQAEHASAYPDLTNAGVNLDLGSLGLDYLLANKGSGYFPRRLVKQHVSRRRLRIPSRARKFTCPVYLVYPEARDEEAYEPILDGLRQAAARLF